MAARARPCAAHTRLLGLITMPNRALRAPRPSQLRCFYIPPKISLRPEFGPPGADIFPDVHHNELRCTSKICCIQLSYAASELSCILLSYDALSELSSALLSYAEPFLATLHPTELCLTLNELSGTLKNIMSHAIRINNIQITV